jgi:hypothetical protein
MLLRNVAFVVAAMGIAMTASAKVISSNEIDVGSGSNHATLEIGFKDGASCTFDVAFSATSVTGMDLVNTAVDANVGLTADIQDFGWGNFVNGFTYNDGGTIHTNDGYGGGADWWHYWIKDSGDTQWTSPAVGASDRVVVNGSCDGWVYGSDSAPTPEPMTLAMLTLGGVGMLLKKRIK